MQLDPFDAEVGSRVSCRFEIRAILESNTIDIF